MVLLIAIFFFACFFTHNLAECADATHFDPTTVSISSESTIAVGTIIAWPAASNPADMNKWLECNGQIIPSDSQYDKLRTVLGRSTVPNYNSQFLRGTTITSQVGQQIADSIRSHAHNIDPHQHTVSGTASGQSYGGAIGSESVSGWANGQYYSGTTSGAYYEDIVTDYGGRAYGTSDPYMGWGTWAPSIMNEYTRGAYTSGSSYAGWTSGSAISGLTSGTTYSGTTSGGTITGYTNYAGGGSTHETGGTETAPIHTKVRYFIRAIL